MFLLLNAWLKSEKRGDSHCHDNEARQSPLPWFFPLVTPPTYLQLWRGLKQKEELNSHNVISTSIHTSLSGKGPPATTKKMHVLITSTKEVMFSCEGQLVSRSGGWLVLILQWLVVFNSCHSVSWMGRQGWPRQLSHYTVQSVCEFWCWYRKFKLQ